MSEPRDLIAPKVILMGAPGSGKTTSLETLLRAGKEVFILFTESNGPDALLDRCRARNTPTDKLRWHFVSPAKIKWDSFENVARMINVQSFEAIANMKMGVERQHTTQLFELIKTVKNFRDDRTGTDYGDVTDWPIDRVFVIDNLSGMNDLFLRQTVGMKPNPSPGEWNIAMSFEHDFIKTLAGDCKCWFVLLAHLDRGKDDVAGGNIVPAAIGAKLGPKLGKDFSEVVLTKRVATDFYWSTSEIATEVKNRALPISDKLLPDFAPLIAAFEARKQQQPSQQQAVKEGKSA